MNHMIPRNKHLVQTMGVLIAALWCMTLNVYSNQAESQQVILPGPERITFHSDVLGEQRTILVQLPEEYAKDTRKYPVLYVLDGEYFFRQAVSAVRFNSELGYDRGQHPIPQMIVVGIVNVDRDRDYTPTHAPSQSGGRLSFPTSGGAVAFREFLEQEVLPLIEARYRAHPDRTLSGWSLGGLFTVHTYLEKPSLFSRYLAISPSLWWDNSVVVNNTRERLEKGDALTAKPLVITLGTLEGGGSAMDLSVRKGFVPLLRSKGLSNLVFTYIEIANETHSYAPYKAYYDGLQAVFAEWRVPAEILGGGLAAVEKFYDDLGDRYGYAVDVPLSVYLVLTATIPNVKPALEAAHRAVDEYPRSSLAHAALGRLQGLAGDIESAIKSVKKALEIEQGRDIPQSENIKAFRDRLQRLENAGGRESNE